MPAPRSVVNRRNIVRVKSFVILYKHRHDGISPTYREIKDALSFSSTSVVKNIIEQLVLSGEFRVIGDTSRGIMVVGGTWEYHPPPGEDDIM